MTDKMSASQTVALAALVADEAYPSGEWDHTAKESCKCNLDAFMKEFAFLRQVDVYAPDASLEKLHRQAVSNLQEDDQGTFRFLTKIQRSAIFVSHMIAVEIREGNSATIKKSLRLAVTTLSEFLPRQKE